MFQKIRTSLVKANAFCTFQKRECKYEPRACCNEKTITLQQYTHCTVVCWNVVWLWRPLRNEQVCSGSLRVWLRNKWLWLTRRTRVRIQSPSRFRTMQGGGAGCQNWICLDLNSATNITCSCNYCFSLVHADSVMLPIHEAFLSLVPQRSPQFLRFVNLPQAVFSKIYPSLL